MSHCVSQVQKSSGMDLLWLFHPTNNITSLPSSAFKDTLNSEIFSPGKSNKLVTSKPASNNQLARKKLVALLIKLSKQKKI